MGKEKRLWITLSYLFLIILLWAPVDTSAKDVSKGSKNQKEPVQGINIIPILPDNQQSSATYFDLWMEPEQKQTIELKLTNLTKKDTKIHVQINPAMTNRNGILTYGTPLTKDNRPDVMAISINEVAKVKKEWTIEAESSVNIPVELSMPKETFDGILLGGIEVSEVNEKTKEDSSKENYSLENEISYVIGLKLQETDKEIPEEINYVQAYASQFMGNNQIAVRMQNPNPIILNNLTFEGKIFQKGSGKLLQEEKKQGYRMAPTSEFIFGIDWGNENFKKGDYELQLIVTNEDTKKEWIFKEEFTITENQVEELREASLPETKESFFTKWKLPIIIVLIIILIAGVVIFFYQKQSKKNTR